MINIDSLNSIPQIKHAIIALSKQNGTKPKYENIRNPFGDAFVQIKENTIYSIYADNINIELPNLIWDTTINPITLFVNFEDKASICFIDNNRYSICAEKDIKLNPSLLYKITVAYNMGKWYINIDEFLDKSITTITPSGAVFS